MNDDQRIQRRAIGNSKEQRFITLAERRMTKLMVLARQICELASFPHTEDQGRRIVSEIKRMGVRVEQAFSQPAQGHNDTFTF